MRHLFCNTVLFMRPVRSCGSPRTERGHAPPQAEGLKLPRTSAASPLLEALVVVQLDDLRGRYVQVLVDLAREVLVEQRLELAVLLLQLGDLGRGRARIRVRARARARVRVRVLGLGLGC